MKFDLTEPCVECPFRNDLRVYLRPERVKEIIDCLFVRDGTFSCHKTNQTLVTVEGDLETVETRNSQHCAGAMIFLEKQGRANQLMRISERLGFYDRRKLDMAAPIFDTGDEMIMVAKKARA